MKQDIHPNWHNDCVVTCSCGNTFTTGSTLKTINVDICGACHPFFTGEMKFVDRQGRVDKFMQKMKLAQQKQAAAKKTKKPKKKSDDQQDDDSQKSYQEILREQRTALRQRAKAGNNTSQTSKQQASKQSKAASTKAK